MPATAVVPTTEDLYQRYWSVVFGIAYQHVKQKEYAEDIAQEVFLRIHKGLPKVRDMPNERGWVFAILYNMLHDEHRKWKIRQPFHAGSLDQVDPETGVLCFERSDPLSSPEDIVLAYFTKCEASAALLPEQREALELWIEGYHAKEIARMTGETEDMVWYRLRKAKEVFRTFYHVRKRGARWN